MKCWLLVEAKSKKVKFISLWTQEIPKAMDEKSSSTPQVEDLTKKKEKQHCKQLT